TGAYGQLQRNAPDLRITDEGASMAAHKNKSDSRKEKVAILRLNGFEAMEPRCLLSVNPVSGDVSGTVFHDINNDGFQAAGEVGIANVLITLNDDGGTPIAVALTDANGEYAFNQLAPGVYSIVETQPVGWTDNGDVGVSQESSATKYDTQRQIKVVSDAHAANIDFAEYRSASVAGSVMEADSESGCTDPNAQHPVSAALIQLLDESGAVVRATKTDSNGNYRFGDVAPGVYQLVHSSPTENALGKQNITVESGQDHIDNEMCQVATPDVSGLSSESPPPVEIHQTDSPVEPPAAPVVVTNQSNLSFAFQPVLAAPAPRTLPTLSFDYSDSGLTDLTPPLVKYSVQPIPGIATTFTPSLWRLVLVDLDTDANAEEKRESTSPFRTASYQPTRLDNVQVPMTGIRIPISGDFDGDGTDELGFYVAGDWFIDLNHNHRWDSDDVWIRLGNDHSTPLTGDWDGDGKCDLGIFEGKRVNRPTIVAKSIDKARVQRVENSDRQKAPKLKVHAVDRVFQFGKATHQPVVGDWDGNGVATIGVFVDGIWQLDVDGNGHWNRKDERIEFGKAGDVAFVGDFNGDGKADLAILRDGVLIVDSNGNRKLDSSDQRIAVEGSGAEMVVGDFNGDGRDEVKMAANDMLRRAS
ncbi:MAG: SdrD B-like domain-containing protein, partial [Planctomycetota bacterium]